MNEYYKWFLIIWFISGIVNIPFLIYSLRKRPIPDFNLFDHFLFILGGFFSLTVTLLSIWKVKE